MKLLLLGSGLLFSLLGLLAGNTYYPRDPEHTLAHVRRGTLRVGYTVAAPWVVPARPQPVGIEPDLVHAFASSLGARIVWVPGTEQHLYEALKQRELDLLIAGTTDESPWKEQVGFTRAYVQAAVYVGAAPGARTAPDLTGQRVAIAGGTDLGHYVRQRESVPVVLAQLPGGHPLVAGYDWQLRRWGYRRLGKPLKQENHVLAVPPGENAWQLTLETFLYQHPAQLD